MSASVIERDVHTRILVTGATGFIGQHLCSSLERAGYSVRATYRNASSRYGDHIDWIHVPDISSETDWSCCLAGVDYVVHLAGLAHKVHSREEDLKVAFNSLNSQGTRRLAEAIARHGTVKRLIFISSAKALPTITSGTGELAPDSEYGRSKRQGEEYVREALQESRTDWCILRPAMVYGEGNLGNMERLTRLIDTGLPLPFGAIRNARSFLYVGNLVSAIECCMTHPGASRRTFCVSDGHPVSTPELVRELAISKGRPARLLPLPISAMKMMARIGDVVRSVTGRSVGFDTYSIDRLCSSFSAESDEMAQALNWKPPYSMRDGLRAMISRTSVEDSNER